MLRAVASLVEVGLLVRIFRVESFLLFFLLDRLQIRRRRSHVFIDVVVRAVEALLLSVDDQFAAALALENFLEELLLDEGSRTGRIAVLGFVLLWAFIDDLPEAVTFLQAAAALVFGGRLRMPLPRGPLLGLQALLLIAAARKEPLLAPVAIG